MDHYYWFALKSVPQVGNVLFRRLVERFGSPEKVLKAPLDELQAVKGISQNLAVAITRHPHREPAEREMERVVSCGCRIVDFLSDEYPRLLREVHDHPPYLYVHGDLKAFEPAIAIVGSRGASSYGIVNTEKLAGDLAENGVAVVSGMARGVDAAAHRGALTKAGRTAGVLGCGLDVVYPPENRRLFAEMRDRGVLVSEFPLGTLPLAENFPRRNRIISGLSLGVLVVEAAEGSGSLITAQCALDQGREVFAIPGSINFRSSRGTNRLIKQGAKLVESVADILEELPGTHGCQPALSAVTEPVAPEEAAVLSALEERPMHIDEVVVSSTLTVGEVSAILLRLELRGIVIQLPGMYFARA